MFRFERIWLFEPGFPDFVRKMWRKTVIPGSAAARIVGKLRILRKRIRGWLKDNFIVFRKERRIC